MLVNYPELNQGVSADLKTLSSASPDLMAAFQGLSKAAYAPGALDAKTKKLIALAIGVAARCEGCLGHYAKELKKLEATDAEVVETLNVAVVMGGGPSLMHAGEALRAWRQM